jgi:hypothetical protein
LIGFLTLGINEVTQMDDHTCGTVALLHVGALLGLFGLPMHDNPWIYGSGPSQGDIQASLAAVLATKGIPSSLAADRAAAAIKKLGSTAITQAMNQSNAWQALKTLTTRPGCNSPGPGPQYAQTGSSTLR